MSLLRLNNPLSFALFFTTFFVIEILSSKVNLPFEPGVGIIITPKTTRYTYKGDDRGLIRWFIQGNFALDNNSGSSDVFEIRIVFKS